MAEGIRITEVVAPRLPGRDSPTDTGRIADARRAALAQAEVVARLVDTIVASIDTIALEAGEAVSFFNIVRLTARDSAGGVLRGLTPRFAVADQNIARFEGAELLGVSVGRTLLRVEAAVPGGPRGVRPRTRTEIPVVVRPARAARATAPADSVPRDLVVALLGRGTLPVSLRVGAVAEGLSQDIVRDGRVLGSSRVGNTATTVVVMPFSARVVLDTVDARLAADGWTPPRPPPQMRGFISSRMSFGNVGAGQGCRDGQHLSSYVRARSPNETLVVMSQQRTPGAFGPCADSAAAATRRTIGDEFPVPILYGPMDAELEARGGGGGGDRFETRAVIRGGASLAEIREHFADQLRRQDWTMTDSAASRDLAVQSFHHVGSDGKRWLGVFQLVQVNEAAPRHLSFLIIRVEP